MSNKVQFNIKQLLQRLVSKHEGLDKKIGIDQNQGQII
jgi:hypothetical protein